MTEREDRRGGSAGDDRVGHAGVAVIFAERDKPDFADKAFVFGALAGSAGVGLFLCLLAMTVIS